MLDGKYLMLENANSAVDTARAVKQEVFVMTLLDNLIILRDLETFKMEYTYIYTSELRYYYKNINELLEEGTESSEGLYLSTYEIDDIPEGVSIYDRDYFKPVDEVDIVNCDNSQILFRCCNYEIDLKDFYLKYYNDEDKISFYIQFKNAQERNILYGSYIKTSDNGYINSFSTVVSFDCRRMKLEVGLHFTDIAAIGDDYFCFSFYPFLTIFVDVKRGVFSTDFDLMDNHIDLDTKLITRNDFFMKIKG